MRKLKVLALFDSSVPLPRGHDFQEEFAREDWKSEAHVVEALRALGHETRMLALFDDVRPLLQELEEFKPDVVFNLMEEFARDASRVPNVVSMLGLLGVPCTGAGPLSLRICKDKALTKSILGFHEVPTPAFQVFEQGKAVRRSAQLEYPLVIKPRVDDSSYGISQASVVSSDEALEERVRFVHEKSGQDALAERYIQGRELYASVLGNHRVRVFPLREVVFGSLAETGEPIATYKVKWSAAYRKKHGIAFMDAEGLGEPVLRRIEEACRDAYRALQLDGYVRMDLRLTPEGEPYLLEVNPNPFIAKDEEFALSAARAGYPWEKLIGAILQGALKE